MAGVGKNRPHPRDLPALPHHDSKRSKDLKHFDDFINIYADFSTTISKIPRGGRD
jgi:hypothetical protein